MATISKGYTFGATETVTSGKLHTLVDSATIASIVNADIDNNAQIADTKLAEITLSNKVNASAVGWRWLDLKNYGAIGDGITDDSAAFNSCLDDAASTGRPIYIPKGTYNLNELEIDYPDAYTSKITIIGEDKAGSILYNGNQIYYNSIEFRNLCFDAWTAHPICFYFESVSIDGITLDNVKFSNCDGMPVFSHWDNTANIGTATNVAITNCEVYNCDKGGFRLYCHLQNAVFANNHFKDCVHTSSWMGGILFGAGGTAALALNTYNVIAKDNTFQGFEAPNGAEGHCILGYGHNINIQGNTIKDCFTDDYADHEAIYIKGYNSIISNNIVLDGNATSAGLIVFKGADISYNNLCEGNIIISSKANQAIFGHGSAVVKGNFINITTGTGISWYCMPSATYSNPRTLILEGNDITSSTVPVSITGLVGGIIANNKIVSDGNSGIALTKYGSDTYPAIDLQIKNNHIEGDGGGDSFMAVTTNEACSKVVMENNFIKDVNVAPNEYIRHQESFVLRYNYMVNNGQVKAFTANDATPTVAQGYPVYKTANVNATTITDFDDGFAGQCFKLIIKDAVTTVDFTSSGLKGNAGVDWSPTTGDSMDCFYDGTDWYCRISDNTA